MNCQICKKELSEHFIKCKGKIYCGSCHDESHNPKNRFIVTLQHDDHKEVFVNGDVFFTKKDAIDYIKWAENMYPDNQGHYRLYEIDEVILQ